MSNLTEVTPIPGTRFCTSLELEAMSERLPVEQSLGGLYRLLKAGELRPGYGEGLFRESPAASPKAERFLGELLDHAVQKKQWVGYYIGWQPRKIEYVGANMDNPEAASEEARGMMMARNAELVKLEIFRDKVYAVPTERLIELARQRVADLVDRNADEAVIKKMLKDTTQSRR